MLFLNCALCSSCSGLSSRSTLISASLRVSGVGVTDEDGIICVVVGDGEIVGGVEETVGFGSDVVEEDVEVEVTTGGEVGKDSVVVVEGVDD